MNQSKRDAVKALVAAAILAACPASGLAADRKAAKPASPGKGGPTWPPVLPDHPYRTPINVIVPPVYSPPTLEEGYDKPLAAAVHDFIRTGYAGRNLPLWDRPLEEIDLPRRLEHISRLVIQACRDHAAVHPVDPAWIMAQIMAESFFYEFAVSSAFAVGICQFIPETARSFGMVTAGDRPEHGAPPYVYAHLVGRQAEFYELRGRKKEASRLALGGKSRDDHLREALEALAGGGRKDDARAVLDGLTELDRLDEAMRLARNDFKTYLAANLQNRIIFNEADVAFLRGFDERATWAKPIGAMVLMMARALKARNGNIIAAAAGYNAGLGNTQAAGVYEPYGCLPSFQETVGYVSRIFVNHYEIVRRLS